MTDIDRKDFDFIWDNFIESTIKKIYEQSDSSFRNRCNLKIREVHKIKEDICSYFFDRREQLKKYYYGQNYSKNIDRLIVSSEQKKYGNFQSDEIHLLDFHKLSALLCRTLIEYKVFDFNLKECRAIAEEKKSENTDWLIKNVLINYRLAFYVSIVFLYQSMLFRYSEQEPNFTDEIVHKYLLSAKKLDLYFSKNTNENTVHESFENCLILNLAKRDFDNRSFDFFMYSTIMYQLEEYNKLLAYQEKL